jgi:hypothetical protein
VEAFNFTLNPANTPMWVIGIVEETANPQPPRNGTIYCNIDEFGQWTEYTLHNVNTGSSFMLTRQDGIYHVRYTFAPLPGQRCRFEYHEWVESGDLVPLDATSLQKLQRLLAQPRRNHC